MKNTPVAVITGASRGLGFALARALAAAGYALVIDGRDAAALHAAAAALRRRGGPVVELPGDIADPAHRAELQVAAADLGGPSLLVNNAGTLGPSPIPPVVLSTDVPPEIRQALRAALLQMHEDVQGRETLNAGMIARFVPVADAAYDAIRRMAREAEAVRLVGSATDDDRVSALGSQKSKVKSQKSKVGMDG